MIELRVEDYCHNCSNFDADVCTDVRTIGYGYNPKTIESEECVNATTIIRCRYRSQCKNIMMYLDKEKKC